MLIRRQLNQFLSQQHLGVRWKLDLNGGEPQKATKKNLKIVTTSETWRLKFLKALDLFTLGFQLQQFQNQSVLYVI